MLEKIHSLDKKAKKYNFFYSLDPKKTRPSTPSQVIAAFGKNLEKKEKENFSQNAIDIFLSQEENFPLNIFWDMDYLISYLASKKTEQERNYFSKRVIKLNEIYGKKGVLNFSYTHDFIYGFDWFRWVQKDYEERKNTEPFGELFLDYLTNRATELKQLIEINDKKYPKLERNQPRNPFSFARDPQNEIKLHLSLAFMGKIPLKAWLSCKLEQKIKREHYSVTRENFARQSQ